MLPMVLPFFLVLEAVASLDRLIFVTKTLKFALAVWMIKYLTFEICFMCLRDWYQVAPDVAIYASCECYGITSES